MQLFSQLLLVALLALGFAHAQSPPAQAPAVGTPVPQAEGSGKAPKVLTLPDGTKLLELEWDDLIPPEKRGSFAGGAPGAAHDYLGEAAPAAQQSLDFSPNPELEGKVVKIPGFIVPLDVAKDGTVSEFFLVPYFGACIHVPPPPPNQIVHIQAPKGIALDSIYEAYWITGKLRVQQKTTRLGAATYAITADKVEIYKY
jgi:hypothetical protein